MSKTTFILNRSKVVYTPGHYDEEEAKKLAQTWARRHPGRTYTVVTIVETYRVPRGKRK